MNRRKADLALVGNTVVWGATFVMVKSALADVTPILFLALRFSLATVALLLIWRRGWRCSPKDWAAGALIGTFLFAGYLLQTLGLRLTSAPKSAFLTGLASVMVPLLGALVYRIRPQISDVAGILAATGGLALMTLEGPVRTIGRGDLLTVGCAVAFAAHIVTLGHYSETMKLESVSLIQVGTAALWGLVLFGWVEGPQIQWGPPVIVAILVTGLLATAAAFTIQAWAQRYTTSTRTALIYTLEPVFAWLTSYLISGESLSARATAGAVLILGGVLLVELKPLNPRLHPSL